ncbi:MAG: cytochrome c [Rhodospirillaceae bacterium]|nr:MAG: cytochrome c [Rhodospirillaceae bacterium]
MYHFLKALTVVVAVAILGCVAFVYSGLYNIGAAEPHWGVVAQIIEVARDRSIRAHAADIATPSTLQDQARVVMGTEHYAAHCAVCHGAPGVPKDDIAEGLYPQPADLAKVVKGYSPAELFWILKNGIKMSGMPAWSDHTDDELWATVAFLEKLPTMTPGEYVTLVAISQAAGEHHHHMGEQDPTGTMGLEHTHPITTP